MSLAHGGKIDPIPSQREDCTAPAAGMQAEQDETFQMLNVSGRAQQARGFDNAESDKWMSHAAFPRPPLPVSNSTHRQFTHH
jgi:hypothetical protein